LVLIQLYNKLFIPNRQITRLLETPPFKSNLYKNLLINIKIKGRNYTTNRDILLKDEKGYLEFNFLE
jgi:hypothetical protein